ncbi:60S ribosomal protein yml6 [Beauveria bassiana D1-5]|uniref:Large ribosomal subunit protein uL4m n=1 Tax=Beauveria bassiana D1-5 TaxID=1245745 RepID=A0A0A2V908_BEABA|nr:60S ribosomal protein yml6 [Beauveria bassiana D1-5]
MAVRTTGCLSEALAALRISTTKPITVSRTFSRSMATELPASNITKSASTPQTIIQSWNPNPSVATVPVTVHSFPALEPTSLEQWSVNHLYLPLRRDLLYSAVVYEGDNTRQGTASSKTRYDVHGSHRKIRPQKGSGRARLGSRQSPSIKGGGKTFGPHPRDFGTKLNRKVYDKAWRTALSYRYRRGELIVCEDGMELAVPEDFVKVAHHFKDGLREATDGRTLFVTGDRRDWLYGAMEQLPSEGRALDLPDVDVKDLLETGKVVMERSVLQEMIEQHQSDLVSRIVVGGLPLKGPQTGEKVL